jgi:hypothetical protein
MANRRMECIVPGGGKCAINAAYLGFPKRPTPSK